MHRLSRRSHKCTATSWENGCCVTEETGTDEWLERKDIVNFLENWLGALARDHRSYVTVAIGCTGGQHRSVYLVERLVQHFSGSWTTLKRHRELDGL